MIRNEKKTGPWRALWVTVAMATAVAVVSAAAIAQVAGEPATRTSGINAEEAAKQRFTKRQFEQLTSKMVELAELLDKAEPQTAKVLREAVSQAQGEFIAEDMEKVAESLSKGLAAAAASTQSEVIGELKKVLQTLRLGILDLDERLERIRQWKAHLEKIDNLIKKEKPLERESNLSDKSGEFSKRSDGLSKELADIIAQQKDLKDKTSKLPPPDDKVSKLMDICRQLKEAIARQTTLQSASKTTPIDKLPINGQLQKILAGTTDKLSKAIAVVADDPKIAARLTAGGATDNLLKAAAESTSQASDAMKEASVALGKSNAFDAADPQTQALHDLNKAYKAVQDALVILAGKDTASDKLAGKQGKLAGRTSDLAEQADKLAKDAGMKSDQPDPSGETEKPGNLDKAKKHMNDAAEKLGSKQRDKATDQQQKALDELEAKKYEVAELKRRMEEKAKQPKQSQADRQKELADQAERTKKQMASKSDTPGTESMDKASKSMSKAAGKLSKGQSGQANKDQKKALEEMDKAREELAEAIEQEEQLAQAEQLEKIDEMLQKVLEQQRAMSATTRETNDKRTGQAAFARPEQIQLAELSRGEGKLAEDVETVRQILVNEGNSVVFTEVLGDVRADMKDVQKLLDAKDPGTLTQAVQKEIEQSLQDMIDAVRKELAERRKKADGDGGGGDGGGGGGKKPLVPPIAELKMIRTMQIGIKRRTASLNKQVNDSKLPAEQAKTEHGKLSRRQEKVRKITEELNTKLNAAAGQGQGDSGGF